MLSRVSTRVFALLLLSVPALSYGYEFVPSEGEFLSWPSYCRAKYVTTPIGQASGFTKHVNGAQIENARAQLGDPVFLHIHHYCSGSALVARAKLEANATQKKFLYSTAIGDLTYVVERIPPESKILANVLFSLAEAYNGLGDRTKALTTLNDAVDAHPENPASHIALGLFLRSSKDLPGARKALERGIDVTGEGSAELNYDLALVLLELNENQMASQYARKAYDLGYPLPGLRNKLIRMGLWDPAPEVAHQ